MDPKHLKDLIACIGQWSLLLILVVAKIWGLLDFNWWQVAALWMFCSLLANS